MEHCADAPIFGFPLLMVLSDVSRGRTMRIINGNAMGVVVVHALNDGDYASSHEKASRTEIARRLAVLKGFEFGGDYEPERRYSCPLYLVPSDTLVGAEEADRFGIRGEHHLFGGVVPHRFVATKALSHSLVDADAQAPAGWIHQFGSQVEGAVLAGFSAFSHWDARRAGTQLLERGPMRIKPVRATGGRGQTVITNADELNDVLESMDAAELSEDGVVLEENLSEVTTYSVGQVRVADLVATYYGTQRLTPDNSGEAVYGGSDLVIVRGDFDALLRRDIPEGARVAVAQARAYDTAAMELFPGMIISRRNYDVAEGLDHRGVRRSGVLEQSWRIGGASSAEIAALEAFKADQGLDAMRASCIEIYGRSEEPPPHATVYFRGHDERAGLITKYTLTAPHADA